MKQILFKLLIFGGIFSGLNAYSQVVCPQNIGFEEGTFNKWQTYYGAVGSNGELELNEGFSAASHNIFKYSYPEQTDYYGEFPVNCPNGSGYTVMLGNASTNKGAEKISYTFTVPKNSIYNLIYNYAVVFQNPGHADYEQPKFTAKVFDVTSNKYTDCGTFEFVASSGLPGFQKSKFGADVFYKDWAPVSINLSGFGGKTLRLEFTTNDCTRGGHFGYAYIDVNENCAEQISGSAYCIGDDYVRLSAPAGFKEYYWSDEKFNKVLGTTNVLTVSPAPPNDTKYALRIIPYDGYGCLDTLYTTVKSISEEIVLKTKPSMEGCEFPGVDLTDPSVTQGSSPGLTFSYFSDEFATKPIAKDAVRKSGRYYIKASNVAGCYKINPVDIVVYNPPTISVKTLPQFCYPQTADLSTAINYSATDPGLTYTYWKDADAKNPLSNPNQISQSGTYYIKGTSKLGCSKLLPVTVTINQLPELKLTPPEPCPPVNLASSSVYNGSTFGLSYSYWMDSKATIPVANPSDIKSSGTYYVQGTSAAGCVTIAPVEVTVFAYPDLIITDPEQVTFPQTIDLESTVTPVPGLSYSFWQDSAATKRVLNYNAIGVPGRFYVRAVDQNSCVRTLPVVVKINPSAIPEIVAPNTFSPNNDGVNDIFKPSVTGVVKINYFKIYNRTGEVVFSANSLSDYWDGSFNGKPLPTGTYYWVFDGTDLYRNTKASQSGSITLVK